MSIYSSKETDHHGVEPFPSINDNNANELPSKRGKGKKKNTNKVKQVKTNKGTKGNKVNNFKENIEPPSTSRRGKKNKKKNDERKTTVFHCSDDEYMMVNDYSDDDINKNSKLEPFKIVKDNKEDGVHRLLLKQTGKNISTESSDADVTGDVIEEVTKVTNNLEAESSDVDVTDDNDMVEVTNSFEAVAKQHQTDVMEEENENVTKVTNGLEAVAKQHQPGVMEEDNENVTKVTNGLEKVTNQHQPDSRNTNDGSLQCNRTVNNGEFNQVLNLTGHYMYDGTGLKYKIDDVDVSQFTEVYLIDIPQSQQPLNTMAVIVEEDIATKEDVVEFDLSLVAEEKMENEVEEGPEEGVMKADEGTAEDPKVVKESVTKAVQKAENNNHECTAEDQKVGKESVTKAVENVENNNHEGTTEDPDVTKESVTKAVENVENNNHEGTTEDPDVTKEGVTKAVKNAENNDHEGTAEDAKVGKESVTKAIENTENNNQEGTSEDPKVGKESVTKVVENAENTNHEGTAEDNPKVGKPSVTKGDTKKVTQEEQDSKTKVEQWLDDKDEDKNESPDSSAVQFRKSANYRQICKITDKPNVNKNRTESRGQYLCRLAREFKNKQTTKQGFFKASRARTETSNSATNGRERSDTAVSSASSGVVASPSDDESVM